MRLVPVALALFHEKLGDSLRIWVQTREDDGPYHGLLEFPGGGIEAGETPLQAAVREVEEEVGIQIQEQDGVFMGTYQNELPGKMILLYVFLFPNAPALEDKGQWLTIKHPELSSGLKGLIPAPNHIIIDDLFLALIS
jgi:mutator protein MutT